MVAPRLGLAGGIASILALALALPVCTGSVHAVALSGSVSGTGGQTSASTGSGGLAGAGGVAGTAGAASADGRYWTIEPRPAVLSASACAVEGQTAFVHAVIATPSSCVTVGPAVASITAPGHIAITGFVWVENGGVCEQIEGTEARDVAIKGLTPGTWSVVDTTGPSTATLVVQGPPPPTTCTNPGPAGAGCLVDCDCSDALPCVAFKGDPSCAGSCRPPCDHDLDCRTGAACTTNSPFASNVCASLAMNACAVPTDCPPGMSCAMPGMGQPDACDWQPILNGGSRHACVDESACTPPLHCVQGDNGKRSCELPCFTSAMRCPSAHVCVPTTFYLGSTLRWVCEWVGE